ncbi:MAG: small multi-drug export protein [Chloroflexota bacterium]
MSPEYLLDLFRYEALVVIITAALPIVELRGAIPVAINLFGLPWHYAFLMAIVGNLLPVPFILLFLNALTRVMNRIDILKRSLDWLFAYTKRRSKIIRKYERIGLALFVAIPLPVTGAWTGSLAAVLLGLSFKHAFLSILIGVVIAGVLVTCLSLLGWMGALIAGVVLVPLAIFSLWRA